METKGLYREYDSKIDKKEHWMGLVIGQYHESDCRVYMIVTSWKKIKEEIALYIWNKRLLESNYTFNKLYLENLSQCEIDRERERERKKAVGDYSASSKTQ
jgi:hypothetical protein